jgi:mutator protein MutT
MDEYDADLPLVACVGAIVRDAEGRLLMIRRRHAPSAGLWSVPGGRIEPGESPEDAIIREVSEETGLEVQVVSLVGALHIPADSCVYDVHDYACVVVGGQLRAGDDAAEARWVDLPDLDALPTPPGFLETVKPWL